jgi:hypothetical protein
MPSPGLVQIPHTALTELLGKPRARIEKYAKGLPKDPLHTRGEVR